MRKPLLSLILLLVCIVSYSNETTTYAPREYSIMPSSPNVSSLGLGYYDNNARFLDILTGSFISRDALAGSYPHLSPYSNCANNALIYIDPTGNDVWQIDNHGYIVNVEENTEYDKLEMVGEEDKSITKWIYYNEDGTIKEIKDYSKELYINERIEAKQKFEDEKNEGL